VTNGMPGSVPSELVIEAGRRDDDAMRSTQGFRLANRLRVARAERALSQDELARAAGVSRNTIGSIETGRYEPSALLAFRLATVLGEPVDQLFWIEGVDR
jgi:putative transcriptional regulator